MDFFPKQYRSYSKCIGGYLQLFTVQAFDVVKLYIMDMSSHFGLKHVRKGLFVCLLFSATEMYQRLLSLSVWLFLEFGQQFVSLMMNLGNKKKVKLTIFLDLIADRKNICYVFHCFFSCDACIIICF